MLPAQHRLRRSRDFTAALKAGRRGTRRTVAVSVAPPVPGMTGSHPSAARSTVAPSTPPVTRVGLVVGRSVGNSVVRHRVSRRLRALLFDRLERIDAGSIVVVRAFPPAADASSQDLAADLDAALERAGQRARRLRSSGGR